MNIRLLDIVITFKKSHERIEFKDFNYFYGQMGAGKSTIARLVDFCLGGELGEEEMTPALQSEFVSASLSLAINGSPLILERNTKSSHLRAQWSIDEEQYDVIIPARAAAGEVLLGTGVEVLSDLVYHLAGKVPPKVRRSKIKEDSDLERLSLRSLLWYCYLDQDSMDSSFFHLDGDANQWKRLKSRDVLRFLVGFHQEQVASLEVRLEQLRIERLQCEAKTDAVQEVLNSIEIGTEHEYEQSRQELEIELQKIEKVISDVRKQTSGLRTNEMEALQNRGRDIVSQIDQLQCATEDVKGKIIEDKAHKNELLALSTRFRRSKSAREILSGVDFKDCPQCFNKLPLRSSEICSLCGQIHLDAQQEVIDEQTAEKDLDARVDELKDVIHRHEIQLGKIEHMLKSKMDEKAFVDDELIRVSKEYDSAYLSTALEAEKRRSALQQQIRDFKKFEVLVQQIADLSTKVGKFYADEKLIKLELKDARERAEKDTKNLSRLKELFLDCLLRAKLPGFYKDDTVEMKSPHFLPEVASADSGDLAVTSFTNLGSGGKKTLFKCCFAIAMHRLSAEIGAMLPTFLIIDSPMKNISERENREQFLGFFDMLYDLCASELYGTQFILIDKEICLPPEKFKPSFQERHMKPDDDNNPPLIRYYRDK